VLVEPCELSEVASVCGEAGGGGAGFAGHQKLMPQRPQAKAGGAVSASMAEMAATEIASVKILRMDSSPVRMHRAFLPPWEMWIRVQFAQVVCVETRAAPTNFQPSGNFWT
jgi:hypothetical protein